MKAAFQDLAISLIDKTFGEFRKSVTISQLATVADGQGGFTESWTTFATVKAIVNTEPTKEAKRFERIFSEGDVVLTMPYYSGITSQMKATLSGQDYNILAVYSVMDADILTELYCEKI